MTDNKKLPDTQKTSARSEKLDTVLAALRAGASLVDPLAGTLTTLATDFIPSQRLKRLEEYAANVGADLKALAARVDNDHLKSDQFAFMFEQCFRGVAEHYQEEKLEAFRGILVNSAIRNDIENDDQEYMLFLVGRLTTLHIKVLAAFAGEQPEAGVGHFGKDMMVVSVASFLKGRVDFPKIETLKGILDDLFQAGLTTEDSREKPQVPQIGNSDYYKVDITDQGRRFIDFITSPVDA